MDIPVDVIHNIFARAEDILDVFIVVIKNSLENGAVKKAPKKERFQVAVVKFFSDDRNK